MFDHRGSSNIDTQVNAIPSGALAEAPTRLGFPDGHTFWVRPSDVLRIETRNEQSSFRPVGVMIYFSDGTRHLINGGGTEIADSIASTLWPTEKSE